ncbi:MAG: penicillin-binding protein 2 [Planctomycetota bacterium]|nr:penicillin-binding protein 2 [Planctomycetota bacterium]
MIRTADPMAHRARVLFAVLLLFFTALVARTGYIQVWLGEEYADRARAQHFREIEVPATRGSILDRNGRVLAVSYHACSVAVDPARIDDPGLYSLELTLQLGEPQRARELARLVARKKEHGKRFVWVKRRLDREPVEALQDGGRAALVVLEEPRRENPHGAAAASLLGVVGDDACGLCGLEYTFDARLRGRPGTRYVLKEGRGRVPWLLFPERGREAVPGLDVVTTLDLGIQVVAERELQALQDEFSPRWSCALVMDPRNGEIVAMAGRPGLYGGRFRKAPPEAFRVPAVHCNFVPGSTLKPLIMASALHAGVVRPGQTLDCGPGRKRFGGRLLHDVTAHGVLSLADVLVKSSNIGMAQVGRALGMRATYATLRAAGFGARHGIELPGEERGRLTPFKRWHPDQTLVSVSMGHELLVTPLQLATMYCGLLNGGTLHPPRLVSRELAPSVREPRRLPIGPDALDFVRRAMVRVVAEGTGRRARIPGVSVGGKTGTSGKFPKGCGKYTASFVAFAPAEAPRFVVLVVADEPQRPDGGTPYGSIVAAPAAGRILREALRLSDSSSISSPSESGVRLKGHGFGMVRVAAVQSSGATVGEVGSPAGGRNPDSAGEENFEAVECRSDTR